MNKEEPNIVYVSRLEDSKMRANTGVLFIQNADGSPTSAKWKRNVRRYGIKSKSL